MSIIPKFKENNTQNINQSFTAVSPPCAGLSEIKSTTAGTASTLNFANTATYNISNTLVTDMTATGNTPITLNSSFDNGGNTAFSFSPVPSKNLYWIGGSGNWNDAAHWTTSSTGSSTGGCVPTPADNVFFNSYSGFTSTDNVVTLDGLQQYCNNMTWNNAPNTPLITTGVNNYGGLQTTSAYQNTLNIGGDLTLQNGMQYKVYKTKFTSNTNSNITTNNVVMYGAAASFYHTHYIKGIEIIGSGTFNVIDDFTYSAGIDFNSTGTLTFNGKITTLVNTNYNIFNIRNSGTINFLDDIDIDNRSNYSFYIDGYNITPTINASNINIKIKGIVSYNGSQHIDISNSKINLLDRYTTYDNSSWNIRKGTISALGSHITFNNNTNTSTKNYFAGAQGHIYDSITFKQSGIFVGNGLNNNSTGVTVNNLVFEKSVTTMSNNTFGNLTLFSGGVYKFRLNRHFLG